MFFFFPDLLPLQLSTSSFLLKVHYALTPESNIDIIKLYKAFLFNASRVVKKDDADDIQPMKR